MRKARMLTTTMVREFTIFSNLLTKDKVNVTVNNSTQWGGSTDLSTKRVSLTVRCEYLEANIGYVSYSDYVLARSILLHELGHVMYTGSLYRRCVDYIIQNSRQSDVDGVVHALNLLEDWRIENMLAKVYAGARPWLTYMVNKVVIPAALDGCMNPNTGLALGHLYVKGRLYLPRHIRYIGHREYKDILGGSFPARNILREYVNQPVQAAIRLYNIMKKILDKTSLRTDIYETIDHYTMHQSQSDSRRASSPPKRIPADVRKTVEDICKNGADEDDAYEEQIDVDTAPPETTDTDTDRRAIVSTDIDQVRDMIQRTIKALQDSETFRTAFDDAKARHEAPTPFQADSWRMNRIIPVEVTPEDLAIGHDEWRAGRTGKVNPYRYVRRNVWEPIMDTWSPALSFEDMAVGFAMDISGSMTAEMIHAIEVMRYSFARLFRKYGADVAAWYFENEAYSVDPMSPRYMLDHGRGGTVPTEAVRHMAQWITSRPRSTSIGIIMTDGVWTHKAYDENVRVFRSYRPTATALIYMGELENIRRTYTEATSQDAIESLKAWNQWIRAFDIVETAPTYRINMTKIVTNVLRQILTRIGNG